MSQRLVVGYYGKFPSKQILVEFNERWNLVLPKIIARSSLSSCEYFFSTGDRVLDAQLIGCSVPFSEW